MDHTSQHQIAHAGWLLKSPPEKRIWKTIPGQYVLEYYTDSSCKKLKGQIDLDQCEQVDAGLQLEIHKQNYDNMFDLRTSKRTYYLVAGSEEEMNKWVECICAVCGLKIDSIQNELQLLPSLNSSTNNNNLSIGTKKHQYSPQPNRLEHQQQSQQSTSESSLSRLNYIPISECYTGKPTNGSDNCSNSPPPRPPKPLSLLQFAKSESALTSWSDDIHSSKNPQNHSKSHIDPRSNNQTDRLRPHEPMLPKSFSFNNHHPNNQNLSMINDNSNFNNLLNNRNSENQKFVYLNSAKQHRIDQHLQNNFYDTWHSRSSSSSSMKRPELMMPPIVNRDLKPNRHKNTGENSQAFLLPSQSNIVNVKLPNYNTLNINRKQKNENNLQTLNQSFKRVNSTQPFKNNFNSNNNNRHTLPRPLIASYTLRNQKNKLSNNENDDYCHLANCEQPKNNDDCERQYLDLYLDLSTCNKQKNEENTDIHTKNLSENIAPKSSSLFLDNHSSSTTNWSTNIPDNDNELNCPSNDHYQANANINSNGNNLRISPKNSSNIASNENFVLPESDYAGTVYKKVDFLKTKAFNEMRLNVNMYRNAN
ncbi:ribosomal protein [Sarcoptes scabiei]|nr:ribosomal protein [Sarcoptes scabiei]